MIIVKRLLFPIGKHGVVELESPLKKLRTDKLELTQAEFAEKLDISRSHLASTESGNKTLTWSHCKTLENEFIEEGEELLIQQTEFVCDKWLKEIEISDLDLSPKKQQNDKDALKLYFELPENIENLTEKQWKNLAVLNYHISEIPNSTLIHQFLELFKLYLSRPHSSLLESSLYESILPLINDIRDELNNYYQKSGIDSLGSTQTKDNWSSEDLNEILNKFSKNHDFEEYEKLHHLFTELISEYGDPTDHINRTDRNLLGDEFAEGLSEIQDSAEVVETIEKIMNHNWNPLLNDGQKALRKHVFEAKKIEADSLEDKEGGDVA